MSRFVLCGAVAALVLWPGLAAAAPPHEIWVEAGSRKVLRDARRPAAPSDGVNLDAARNEYEPFQVLVAATTEDLERVTVSLTDLVAPNGAVVLASQAELRLAHYLHLTEAVRPTHPAGWYPDALLPLDGAFRVTGGQNQAVWVNLFVAEGTPAGRYLGTARVDVDGAVTEILVRLQVRDFSLPVANHSESAFAIWGGFMAEHFGLQADSPEYRALYDRAYWFLVGYRLAPDDLPVAVDSPEAAAYLDDPRVSSFRIPYDPADPEGFRRRAAYLRERGWLAKGYVYTLDEPELAALPDCRAYGARLDEQAPDVRWLLTSEPHPELYGAVDIWCPDLAYVDREAIRVRQALGEPVWWYTCVVPQHPYPTYLINDDAVSARVLSWLQAAWGIKGVLYWSVSIWGRYDGTQYVHRDVWTEPLAYPRANGDGYLIYPGRTAADQPVPSLRLEMIRQGNEDFEALWLLEERLRQAATSLGVPGDQYDPRARPVELAHRVAQRLRRWERDPAVLEAARRTVMDEVEAAALPPLALLTTSVAEGQPTTATTAAGDVWTEPGAEVEVFRVTSGTRAPLATDAPTAGRAALTRFTLPLDTGATELVVEVRQGAKRRVLSRTFRRVPPVVAEPPVPLCTWETPQDTARWVCANAQLRLDHREELGTCARVTFTSDSAATSVRLEAPRGFADTDWRGRGHLLLALYNPEAFPVQLRLKAFDRAGNADDGLPLLLPPRRLSSFAVPLDDLGVSLAEFRGLEIRLRQPKSPATLYLGPLMTQAGRGE